MSELNEIFIKRYLVERTNLAEIKLEEKTEKLRSCRENLWNEIQLKGPQRQKHSQEQNKKESASSIGLCKRHKPKHPQHVKMSRVDISNEQSQQLHVIYTDTTISRQVLHDIITAKSKHNLPMSFYKLHNIK